MSEPKGITATVRGMKLLPGYHEPVMLCADLADELGAENAELRKWKATIEGLAGDATEYVLAGINADLKAENAELYEALFKLEAWGKCFIETTPISAETLWREFPLAMERASETLAAIQKARAS